MYSRPYESLNKKIRQALIYMGKDSESEEVLKEYGFVGGDFFEATKNLITDLENYE